jgi:hypothetical protein
VIGSRLAHAPDAAIAVMGTIPGASQLQQRVYGRDQQQGRRIETWRRSRELNSVDGVTKNTRDRMAEGVHDAGHDCAHIEDGTQPARIPECEW